MNKKFIWSVFTLASAFSATAQMSASSVEWWRNFNDPTLDSLIYMGQNNNLDLAQAVKRLEMARLAVSEAKSGYYPTFTAGLGWNRSRTSAYTTRQGAAPMSSSYFSLGVDMNWQIDLFGRVNEHIKEEKGAYNASREDYDWMCVTMTAEIASAYMSLRTLQQELIVTQQQIEQQKEVLDITEIRFEAGLVSMLDVAQARTDYYSTEASVYDLQSQIQTTINSIAVLSGTYPSEMQAMLSTPAPQPDGSWSLTLDVSPDQLRNRPDVKEAEYTVEQYAAALGVEKKQWLPSLSLTASVATEAWHLEDMFKGRSFSYSIAPQLSWTIFDGFARNAQIASAREQMMSAIDSYNLTLLTAVQEVDNAITTYKNAVAYEKEISIVLENARKAYDLALERYKQGLDGFINVSNAQLTVLQYANEMVIARGNVLSAIVNLQKSLAL